MLLAIDIGNSNVVFGCLNEENQVVRQFRMVTDLKKASVCVSVSGLPEKAK